jgi:hypothetical protein
VNLGADILATLPELRSAAESMMVDTCVIAPWARSDVLDEATGEYEMTLGEAVYEGPCRYRAGNTAVHEIDAEAQALIEQSDVLSVPLGGSELVTKDMAAVVTLTLDNVEPFTVRITGGHQQTFSTARRFPVERVS